MADANAAYTIADASHLAALDEFHLIMLEQPLGADDLLQLADLQRRMKTPLCLDESITDLNRARAMIALGSLPNFSLPGDLSPSARYWRQDVVSPEWTMDAEGMVHVPRDRPGIGV